MCDLPTSTLLPQPLTPHAALQALEQDRIRSEERQQREEALRMQQEAEEQLRRKEEEEAAQTLLRLRTLKQRLAASLPVCGTGCCCWCLPSGGSAHVWLARPVVVRRACVHGRACEAAAAIWWCTWLSAANCPWRIQGPSSRVAPVASALLHYVVQCPERCGTVIP